MRSWIAAFIALLFSCNAVIAADSYTPNLRVVQMVPGSNASTWGTKANSAFAMLDEAISKVTTISVTGGNVTLTTANNSTDQARSAVIVFTGTPGTTRTATAPNVQKVFYLYNNSDSTIVFNGGAGTTVSVASLSKATVYTDGATNAVALYNVSGFAATILDDVNAAAAQTTLGLGTLATQSGTFSGSFSGTFTGTHSGASSGTNTGDQTITLTGDVGGSGTSSFAATIASNAVTIAKMAQVASGSLLGRLTAGTGNVEVLASSLFARSGSNADITGLSGTTLVNGTLSGATTLPGGGAFTAAGNLSSESHAVVVPHNLPTNIVVGANFKGMKLLFAYISGANDTVNYGAVALVIGDGGGSFNIVQIHYPMNMSFDQSGGFVRVTQLSGVTQTIDWFTLDMGT